MWIRLVSKQDYKKLPEEGKELINRYDKGMFFFWSLVGLGFGLIAFNGALLPVSAITILLIGMNIVYRRGVDQRE